MRAIEFEGHNVVFAKDQAEYEPLPVHIDRKDPNGTATSCWQLSDDELAEVARTGRIFVSQFTFQRALQPIKLSTTFTPPTRPENAEKGD